MPTVKPVSDLKNNIEVLESTIQLLIHLEQGETSAHENGWLSADQVETLLKV